MELKALRGAQLKVRAFCAAVDGEKTHQKCDVSLAMMHFWVTAADFLFFFFFFCRIGLSHCPQEVEAICCGLHASLIKKDE